MKIVPWLGWSIFGFALLQFLAGYGSDWDLSWRYRMPTTLLSHDGTFKVEKHVKRWNEESLGG